MQYKIFTLPVKGDDNNSIQNEMNAFIRSHKVFRTVRRFVPNGDDSLWCFCVEYIESANGESNGSSKFSRKIDYMEELPEEEFKKFSILRECRKILADERSVPAYTVFLDSQLAELSKKDLKAIDKAVLLKVNNYGEKKFEKYGIRFLELLSLKLQDLESLATQSSEDGQHIVPQQVNQEKSGIMQ